ncbi:MAG: hypothetical protein V1799_19550 [bacterium]
MGTKHDNTRLESRPPELKDLLKVCDALSILPDKASLEATPDDLINYMVVKIADEIVVDLLISAGGYAYNEVASLREMVEIEV